MRESDFIKPSKMERLMNLNIAIERARLPKQRELRGINSSKQVDLARRRVLERDLLALDFIYYGVQLSLGAECVTLPSGERFSPKEVMNISEPEN